MNGIYIGIDTSNYTTSLSVIDSEGIILSDIRIPLNVDEGKKGLRQSEAVFQHIQNLEHMASYIKGLINIKVSALAASCAPRSVEGSYMPVFIVSKNIGMLLSAFLNIPFYETTHQLGHLRNGLEFTKIDINRPFIAVHYSGGTNEILSVKVVENRIHEEIIGHTLDITAGQLIDRIGVYTGLSFPSGSEMESLVEVDDSSDIVNNYYFKEGCVSYSGVETYLKKLIDENRYPIGNIYYRVFCNIGESLEKAIKYHCRSMNIDQALLFGGVLGNSVVKNFLMKNFLNESIELFFCSKNYTGDNAVGVALIAKDNFGEQHEY